MKKILLSGIIVCAIFATSFAYAVCPANTEVGETTATLVGEVQDMGGDTSVTAWFQYDANQWNLNITTPQQTLYSVGSFCSTIVGLTPGQKYWYQAVAQNSAGASMGEKLSFTTKSSPVSFDLKVNGSDGPLTLNVRSVATLSWTSQNAVSCQASGDWTGAKNNLGSVNIQLNSVKTYTFSMTCTNGAGTQTDTDSVTVTTKAIPPTVITKPAVVTL